MKTLRRCILVLCLVTALVCAILLLNVTAPNPTHRRYSSRSPLITGQGDAQAIGESGANILAEDLHIPRNDDADQLQCICREGVVPPERDCRVCSVTTPLISTGGYRRPDFITPNYIAESKNVRDFLYSRTDTVDQIADYVTAARAMGVPLWVFIRVNTTVSPEYYSLVEATGGGIVPYFSTPDYVDPVDQAAKVGLLVSGSVMGLLLITGPSKAVSHRSARSKAHVVNEMHNSADTAEAFIQKVKAKKRLESDIEDDRQSRL